MSEMFIPDFDRHLRNDGHLSLWISINPSALAAASDEDLRSCYTQNTTFIYLASRFYLTAISERHQLDDEACEKDPSLASVLPIRAIEILKRDPLIAREFLDEDNEESDRSTDGSNSTGANGNPVTEVPLTETDKSLEENGAERKEEDSATATKEKENDSQAGIRSLEQLKNYISVLRRANAILSDEARRRPHLKALLEAKAKQSESDEFSLNPRAYTLTDDWFGYAKGTRVICVNALIFHMDLVEVDGQLKIANLYIADD
jgi:hypothetical protein